MRATLLLGLMAAAGASSLSVTDDDAKNRPVSKVITLLKDMQKELEAEAKADQEVYDTFACWCETNEKEKTKAIADAEAKINDLNVQIEELTAASTRLNSEIKMLETEVGKNQDGLSKATGMRFKDQGEFNGEEADLLQSIKALKSAIIVLSKHHPGAAALLQFGASGTQIMQVATVLDHEMEKHAELLKGVLTHKQRNQVTAFVQQAPSAGSYAPQSGQILGILKQMLETFESNLSQTQKDELQGSADYENLKAAKENEIGSGQDQIEAKTQELATTDEKNAQAKQDLEDTEASLAADKKFLENLRAQCSSMDAEWEARSKVRTEEMEAVAKALEILSGDDAHDLFTKTFNFVQKREAQGVQKRRRAKASKLLASVAKKTHNPKLMTLALRVRLDAFTKVKKAIDDMVAELMKQQADEVKLKDYCVEALNENLRNTQDKERTKKSLEETIDDLKMTIQSLTESIDTLKAEIKEMQFQMKRAGEDREKENVEFQTTVADSRATQKLLTQALEVLKGFYDKKAKAAALLQAKDEQTPPPGFKAYKKNESSGGVMGMIQQIIDDAKLEEQDTITAEADAQKAYETFVKDTNASIEEKTKDIVNKSEEKAKAEEELVKSEETLAKTMTDLEGLSQEAADLHGECDFVLKNFEIRQSSRMQEIEALKQVKAILSGAKFANFMQSDAFADDGSSIVDDGSSEETADPLDAYLN